MATNFQKISAWVDGGVIDWKERACANQPAVTVVKFLHALPKN